MAQSKDEGGFDRDFGYLLPFLDRVEQAAAALTDPASRERLLALIADEKRRWPEIRDLLAGKQTAPEAARVPAEAARVPAEAARAPAEAAAPARTAAPSPGLTVGSLRPKA